VSGRFSGSLRLPWFREGMKHADDVCERRRTRSSVSRMRYSHKIFDSYSGSSTATSGLSYFPSVEYSSVQQSYSNCFEKLPHYNVVE
jgi:hypothetical protein